MEKYLPVLKQCTLFKSIEDNDIFCVIDCLEGYIKEYDKKEIIYNFHDNIVYAGIVLDGKVEINMLNFNGNKYGVRTFIKSEQFATAYACLPASQSNVQIIAQEKSQILFLKLTNLFSHYNRNCPFIAQITENVLKEIAKKNIFQNKNIQILIQNKIRDKLFVFMHSVNSPDGIITLPFNRQGFANHLGVDRSALSRELSRMKAEGLIDFHKNKIYIKQDNLF